MTEHKQVEIKFGDMKASVDEGIADLILEIWKAGINTVLSCQENQPGIVWIDFMTVEDGQKFLSIVAKKFPKTIRTWRTLYGRVMGFGSKGDWTYNVHPLDLNALSELKDDDEIIYNVTGNAEIFFSFSARFPIQDTPLVMKRLKNYNHMNNKTKRCKNDK